MSSMLDCPLVLQVKLAVVNRIEAQSNKFVTGMETRVQVSQNLMIVLYITCTPIYYTTKLVQRANN